MTHRASRPSFRCTTIKHEQIHRVTRYLKKTCDTKDDTETNREKGNLQERKVMQGGQKNFPKPYSREQPQGDQSCTHETRTGHYKTETRERTTKPIWKLKIKKETFSRDIEKIKLNNFLKAGRKKLINKIKSRETEKMKNIAGLLICELQHWNNRQSRKKEGEQLQENLRHFPWDPSTRYAIKGTPPSRQFSTYQWRDIKVSPGRGRNPSPT